MTNITGRRTINTIKFFEIDGDPTSGGGVIAPVGSIASRTDGYGISFKSSSSNTGWTSTVAGSGTTNQIAFWDGYHSISGSTTLAITNNIITTSLDVSITGILSGFGSKTVEYTNDHILINDDCGKILLMNKASAVTVTIPNALKTGFGCVIIQTNTGTVSFNTSGGATVNNRQGHTSTAGQYGSVGISQIGVGGSNNYVLFGDTQ